MNWFTRSVVAHYPHDLKKKEVQEWGGCEHVIDDPSLLYIISYENDSFGREGYCMCEECHKSTLEAKEEEQVQCHDCHLEFARKDTVAWTPYDYYPRQGDRPINICVKCQTQPKHLSRVSRDETDRIEEEAFYDQQRRDSDNID